MSKSAPLAKGSNGRDEKGRFIKGWKGGPGGHPQATKVAKIRAAVLNATSDKQVARIIRKLGRLAEEGKPWAVREFLKYVVGKPVHIFDPRQGLPADGEQQSKGPQYTAQERMIIARAMAAQAERELRGEEEIEAEGEEVRDG